MAYLMIAKEQYEDRTLAGNYNVGPDEENCLTTGELVTLFCKHWNAQADGEKYRKISWINRHDGGPHEANFLKLDCTKLKVTFGWKARWNMETTMDKIVTWTKCYFDGGDVGRCMDEQTAEYLSV